MAKRGGFPGGMPGNMNNLMKQAQRMQRQMEEQQAAPKEKKAHGVAAEFNEEDIHFCYCTEFIINKEDPNADPLALRAYLES